MSDQTCVDCGQEISICDHALQRITDPTSAFQGKVIGELQDELAESTARADRLAVEVSELLAALAGLRETGPDEPLMAELPPSRASYSWFCGRPLGKGHDSECAWERCMALLDREPDQRGAEILGAAADLAHWLQVWIDNHPGQTWCYSEAALDRYRALGVVGGGAR